MNRLLRTLTILIFALLQSVAPLVHAHIGDQPSGASILAQAPSHHSSTSGIDRCFAEQDASQTISLPQEYQRDDTSIISNTLFELSRTIPWSFHSLSFTLPTTALSNATLFRTPPAQAPPYSNT